MKLRDSFILFMLLILMGFVFANQKTIRDYIVTNFIYTNTIIIPESNKYKKTFNNNNIQETNNFIPNNYQDLENIFYTILNNGWKKFSFYCDINYEECKNDLTKFSQNSSKLSSLNNYVAPFNAFSDLTITTNSFSKVTVEINYLYDDSTKYVLNEIVDNLIKNLITEQMTTRTKIKVIHDYIINNSYYDLEKAKQIENGRSDDDPNNKAHTAYGPLVQGKAICGGYTDAMALFLDKLNIPNFKISTRDHVWNYVFVENNWLHIDLTWDDPILSSGKNILIHKFFLINSDELARLRTGQHNYNTEFFNY